MTNFIDKFLNGITMYRLLLYFLIGLVILGVALSFFGLVAFQPLEIVGSTVLIVAVCWVTNTICAKFLGAPTNLESVYITALILALIVSPATNVDEMILLIWAGVLAMTSKYILTIYRRHIFNPAAISVVITAFALGQAASWWISNSYTFPVMLVGGLLIMRKIRQEDMVLYFFTVATLTAIVFCLIKGSDPLAAMVQLYGRTSLLFFGFIMVTEPLTAPADKNMQAIFAIIVGILFYPSIHIGNIYSTPELALVIGNVFAYLVNPKHKVFGKLKEKIQASPDVIDFILTPHRKLNFAPGQYMEWTLAHRNTDSRGSRRYFTIASSPTEDDIRLGVKFYPNGSSYKRALAEINSDCPFVGAHLAGDFTLPTDPKLKLVFIAGGIGITPFRSMLKYLIDTNESRDITVFYTNALAEQIVYRDVLDEAQAKLNIKIVYTLTKVEELPAGWSGKSGRINADMIKQEVPDFAERWFYISGSQRLVDGMKQTLHEVGVRNSRVITDFFPGLA